MAVVPLRSKRGRTRQIRSAYKSFAASETGRLILEDLRHFCHADQPTYVQGDATATAFQEGMRRVYLHFMGMARMSTEELDALTQEITIDER